MSCFRDMTFCPHHTACVQGKDCSRALTDEVVQSAIMWWGSDEAPIEVYLAEPWCMEPKMEEGNDDIHAQAQSAI